MSVHKTDIPIPDPCDADWDEMHDRGTRRFCDHCTKDVHDLSSLTQAEAMALLEQKRDEHVCVRYAHHDGEVFFKDSTSPVWRLSRQLEGAKVLLAAAALVVPMLAAGCDTNAPATDPTPEAVSPITIGEDGASIEPGAGIKPSFGGEAKPLTEELVGEPAVEEVAHEMGEAPAIEEEMGDVEHVQESLGEVQHLKGDVAHEPEPKAEPKAEPIKKPLPTKIGKVMLPEHRKGKFVPPDDSDVLDL
jgi:hypothetical protein